MKDNFDKTLRFCYYVVTIGFLFLGGLIWIPVPQENQSMANLAMGFITATILGVPIAYIFGGNPKADKKGGEQATGTTTAEFTAHVTTEPIQEPKEEDK